MVDPVSGSGGVPPVKNVNKSAVKPAEAKTLESGDAVEISDDALALAQAAEVKAQLTNDPTALLSNPAQNVDQLL